MAHARADSMHLTHTYPHEKTGLEKFLDVVERVGNKVPHPVVIFVLLIGLVILLSHVFYLMGASVTYQTINTETHAVEEATTAVRSLLTVGRHPLHVRGRRSELHELHGRRGHHRRDAGRRRRRIGRPDQGDDSQARDGRSARRPDLHPRVHRDHLEHRCGCRISGADSAGGGSLSQRRPASAGRACRIVCRRRRRVQRQHLRQAARWHAGRDYQRRHRAHESRPSPSR